VADARKPCRCTLLESGQADMAKLVRDYVDSLSADEKTDEATYAARLNICRTCDNLHSGTCADLRLLRRSARREETAGVSESAGKVGRGGSGIA